MIDPIIVTRLSDSHPRFSIYVTLLLGLVLFTLILSVYWIIVFAGLLTWRPKYLRDEEAGIEMTTQIVDDSSLEIQYNKDVMAIPFVSGVGFHSFTENAMTSSKRGTGSLVKDDPVRSTNGSSPK